VNFSCSDLANLIVSNKVDDEEFESEENTGNGNSFVRHFDEKLSKAAENRRKSVRISRILAPLQQSNSGGLDDAPRSPVRL